MLKIGNSNFFSNSFNKINYLFSNVAYNIFYSENKSQIEQIRREFFDGKIQKAHEYLQTAREEHNSNKKDRYDFLLLETEFLFQLNNYQAVKSNLTYIKENLTQFINQDFYQMQISLYALDNNKIQFDKIAEKLKKEFASNQPNEYFEIIYALNSGQQEKAKELYEEYIKNNNNKLLYIGGLIYANLHMDTQSDEYYKKADMYYTRYLEDKEPNFFERLEIYKFYSRTAFNKLLLNHLNVEYKEKVEKTRELLASIKDSFHYFNKMQKKFLVNHYLHCLFILDKKEFINYYNSVNENEIDVINFGFLHLDIEECSNTQVIENRILSNDEIDLLIHYHSKLILIDPQKVIDFLDIHIEFLDNEIILNIYLDAKIRTDKTLTDEEYYLLEEKKDNSIISYISYLEAKQIKSFKISDNEIETLLAYLKDGNVQEILIIKIIRILSQNLKQKKYLDLAIEYKNDFQNVISETLKICEIDRNLLVTDFDDFVEQINNPKYSIQIANIYRSYPSITKAYKFYKIAWEHFDFLDNDKIEFASYVLHYCSLPYYFQNTDRIDIGQDNIYKSYLEENSRSLNMEQTFVLSYYLIVIEKSFENGFLKINSKLLSINVNDLTKNEKELLSKLYLYSIVNHIDEDYSIKSNQLIKDNGNYYISEQLYSTINEHYLLKPKNQKEFDLLLFKEGIEKLSIFHYISNIFMHSLNSENFRTVISTEDDPLIGIREMLHENTKQGIKQFEDYSSGKNISFFSLANGEYKNYFKVIDILLNTDKYNFHTGNSNSQPYEINKILTFSSIVFLDNIKKLDIVLEREDVYIQKTTINWLVGFIKELDSSDEIFSVYSDGENLLKNISNKEDIEKDKQNLLDLANKIISADRVIDDIDTILPIKESYQMLAPHIGEQEYRALAYSHNHHYQIISEDRMISYMFDTMKLDNYMISNSISLLSNKLGMKKLFSLYKELDEKKYSYLFNEQAINNFLKQLIFEEPIYLLQWHEKKYSNFQLEELLHIVYKYGWIDWIEEYYRKNYILVPPKIKVKPRTFITSNIEYILELLGIKIIVKEKL